MLETTWQQLLADKRVWLGPFKESQAFKYFVDIVVPEIIEEYEDDTATFARWIEVQHKIAAALAEISTGKQNQNIALSLSSYDNIDLFLMTHDTTEARYALQMKGLFGDEYDRMQIHSITVGELYKQNPVAFFGPLLRKNERHVQ
jgi:hypothetical protein